MVASLLWLIMLSGAMFAGSFIAGNIPLSFQMSEDKMRVMSTFSAGLMVGTALIVILPEGVETLYSVQYAKCHETVHRHGIHRRATLGEFVDATTGLVQDTFLQRRARILSTQTGEEATRRRRMVKRGDDAGEEDSDILPSAPEQALEAGESKSKSTPTKAAVKNHAKSEVPAEEEEDKTLAADKAVAEPSHVKSESPSLDDDHFDAHMYIGPSLAFGFGVMFLIDQIFQTHPHGSGGSHTHIVALTDFRALPQSTARSEGPAVGKSIAATIGLIVHAAADGIALGAASASNRASLELLVFVAIMLHKAPSAFGLSTFLLDSGHSRKTVRQHLLAFSCSAPAGAIATYASLKWFVSDGAAFDMNKWTGILLLFSAGTFLFVSTVHILPEVCSRPHGSGHGDVMNGNALDRGPAAKGSKEQQSSRKMTFVQVLVVICGLCAPYFLTGYHGH